MLNTMRNNLKSLSWTLWLVIITFIGFIFVEWGMGSNTGNGGTEYIIQVDGEPITRDDLRYLQTLQNIPNAQALNMLQQQLVLYKEATKLGMIASERELNAAIFDRFQEKGVFIGKDLYRNYLSRNRINVKSFENFIKKYIIMPKKYMDFVMTGNTVEEGALKKAFKKSRDYAQIEYIKIQPEWIKDQIAVTDKEMQAHYDKNKNSYFAPEKRNGKVFYYTSDFLKKGDLLSEKEISDYYRNNKSQFRKKEKTRVSRIFWNYTKKNKDDIVALAKNVKQTLTSQNFSQKAKEFSQDEKSSAGGDWGYDLDKLIKKERKIARSMKVSEISDLIYTGKSVSIIHVTEKSDAVLNPLESVRQQIVEKLEPEKLKKIAEAKIAELVKTIKAAKDLSELAKIDGLKIKDTGFIKKDQLVDGLDESSTLSNELFKLKKNGVSGNLDLIQETKHSYGVVKCIEIRKAGIEKLELVKERVKNDVIRSKKIALLKTKTPAVTAELNKLKDEKLTKKFLEDQKLVSETFRYKRGNRLLYFPIQEGLDEKIFGLTPGQYSDPIQFPTTAMIVKLKSKKISNDQEYDKDRDGFYDLTLRQESSAFMQNFLQNKLNSYTSAGLIKYDKELVESLTQQQKQR